MDKYNVTLTFPSISQSIPVTIIANSAEEALTKIHAGEGTTLHIGSGDENSPHGAVSKIYIETLRMTKSDLTDIYTHIFAKGDRDSNITETVCFPDEMEMDIVASGGVDEPGWTESILFSNGSECGVSDVDETFEGMWDLIHDDVLYIAIVVPEDTVWETPNIITLPGSCLNSTAQVIAHQTNCKGVMGAGVALAIRQHYPEIMQEYQAACRERHMLGECQLIATEDERYIANLFGQDGCGAGRQTDYDALQSALNSLVEIMYARGLTSISMPYNLGCGLAGGDWGVVFEILKKTFADKPFRLELWQLP